jgi:hypothetical protein
MVKKEIEQLVKGIGEIDPHKIVGSSLENRIEVAKARIYLVATKLFVSNLKATEKISEEVANPVLDLVNVLRKDIELQNPGSEAKTLEDERQLSSALLYAVKRAKN